MAKYLAAGALALAPAALSLFVSAPAKAACLTATSATPNPDNNCLTYNNVGAPTVATLTYSDQNLTNNYWQIGIAGFDPSYFSDWKYKKQGDAGFTSFDPGFTGPISGFYAGTVFNTTTTPSAPASAAPTNIFQIQVTLSTTAAIGSGYQFQLRTNATGVTASSGGLSQEESLASNLTRSFTRQADPTPPSSVPGPLPLFGAAAAFGYSRKLRKAIRATAV